MIREEKEEEEEEEEEKEEQNGRVVLCVNQFAVPSSSRMNAEMSLSATQKLHRSQRKKRQTDRLSVA